MERGRPVSRLECRRSDCMESATDGFGLQHPDVRLWPDFTEPVERVGKSLLLYYVPPHPELRKKLVLLLRE
jgi:hypothetical protein